MGILPPWENKEQIISFLVITLCFFSSEILYILDSMVDTHCGGVGSFGVILQNPREAKVGDFTYHVAVYQYVASGQIPMDKSQIRKIFHAWRNSPQHANQLNYSELTIPTLKHKIHPQSPTKSGGDIVIEPSLWVCLPFFHISVYFNAILFIVPDWNNYIQAVTINPSMIFNQWNRSTSRFYAFHGSEICRWNLQKLSMVELPGVLLSGASRNPPRWSFQESSKVEFHDRHHWRSAAQVYHLSEAYFEFLPWEMYPGSHFPCTLSQSLLTYLQTQKKKRHIAIKSTWLWPTRSILDETCGTVFRNLLRVTTPSRWMTLGWSNWAMMLASLRKSLRCFSL